MPRKSFSREYRERRIRVGGILKNNETQSIGANFLRVHIHAMSRHNQLFYGNNDYRERERERERERDCLSTDGNTSGAFTILLLL